MAAALIFLNDLKDNFGEKIRRRSETGRRPMSLEIATFLLLVFCGCMSASAQQKGGILAIEAVDRPHDEWWPQRHKEKLEIIAESKDFETRFYWRFHRSRLGEHRPRSLGEILQTPPSAESGLQRGPHRARVVAAAQR